jgi:hypothetical protein
VSEKKKKKKSNCRDNEERKPDEMPARAGESGER